MVFSNCRDFETWRFSFDKIFYRFYLESIGLRTLISIYNVSHVFPKILVCLCFLSAFLLMIITLSHFCIAFNASASSKYCSTMTRGISVQKSHLKVFL